MPNQLSQSKRRYSMSEHEAVLAAFSEVARRDETTVANLLRRAAREFLRKQASVTEEATWLHSVVQRFEPQPPENLKTAAQLRGYKRRQREFDDLLLELDIASPSAVNERNSVVAPASRVRILELEPERRE